MPNRDRNVAINLVITGPSFHAESRGLDEGRMVSGWHDGGPPGSEGGVSWEGSCGQLPAGNIRV